VQVKKNGKRREIQHYRCKVCGKQYQSKRRQQNFDNKLWRAYVWGRQTLVELAHLHKRSKRWIRKRLDCAVVVSHKFSPRSVVIVADTVFHKHKFGVCVFRAAHFKRNLCWAVTDRENSAVYRDCRLKLEQHGFELIGAVIDGKPGLFEVFRDIPVQMCHFHQIAIISRYLTRRPKLEAGQELRMLTLTLPYTIEEKFSAGLHQWYKKWEPFLKEKTFNLGTKRWFYTHKPLRSAYRSLRTNLPLLFTCLRYPELNMPNTTNCLDGIFAHLKDKLRIHRGLKLHRKVKLINEILSK